MMRAWMYHIGLAVQMFVLSYIYVQGKNGMCDVYTMQKNVDTSQERVIELARDIDNLKDAITAWNNDVFHKEKIAREHLHMYKPKRCEIVYYR